MSSDPQSEARRGPLGERVTARRLSLRLAKDAAAAAAGMSAVTWTRVEEGEPVRSLTLIGVDRVLGWEDGAASEFLATGREPIERAAQPAEPPGPVGAGVDPEVLADLATASPEAIEAVKAVLRAAKG